MPRLTKLSRSIAGKIALVTGAASGMGRATAHLFADEGAKVAVLDRNAEGVTTVVQEITGAGGDAKGWTLDLANADEIAPAISEIATHFGGLDVLVNNAGIDAGRSSHAAGGSSDKSNFSGNRSAKFCESWHRTKLLQRRCRREMISGSQESRKASLMSPYDGWLLKTRPDQTILETLKQEVSDVCS